MSGRDAPFNAPAPFEMIEIEPGAVFEMIEIEPGAVEVDLRLTWSDWLLLYIFGAAVGVGVLLLGILLLGVVAEVGAP